MKFFLLVAAIPFFAPAFSQDTTELIKYYNGAKSYKLITKKDTLLVCTYPTGKKESVRELKGNKITGTYTRWYENGNLMWQKELKHAIPNGKSVYYNEKGIKVAELMYENGKISDTIYIKANTHLLFGKITYTSRVHGGVENEDGTSNISESSGPYSNCYMYAAKVDSFKKPELICNYKSDVNGDFFITVPIGTISFFTVSLKIDSLKPGQFTIPSTSGESDESAWDKQGPIVVKKENSILFIELHHSSNAYAP